MAETLVAQGGQDWDDESDAAAAYGEFIANGLNPNFTIHPDMTATDYNGRDLEDEAAYNRRMLKQGLSLPTVGRVIVMNQTLTAPMHTLPPISDTFRRY